MLEKADLRLILAFFCCAAGEPDEDAWEGGPQINPSFFMMQENLKKMLEKADTLGRHGVSTKTIKLFFNASTDDQLSSAMKQLEGK